MLAALISVLTTTGIVLSLLEETISFFGEVGLGDFLFGTEWSPLFEPASFGVLPLVLGTMIISLIGMLVAVPLGLGAAVYLAEYAHPRVRRIIKPILELLAGVPTIVFGYFALTFFTPEILRGLVGLDAAVFNGLSAGIIIGFLIIPTIASISEDSMSAVPASAARGLLRARGIEAPDHAAGGVPGRPVGHRRLGGARLLARGGRDDGGADRCRPSCAVGRQSAGGRWRR